ncbi:MAG: TonB-dependent receptor plug domain-containing protein, partial [Gemmatimonadota bacterium]
MVAAVAFLPATALAERPGGDGGGEAARMETPRVDGAIRGRVFEEDGSTPIAGAQVIVVGTRLGAMSAADGTFIIRGVTAGTVQVRALRLGYQPVITAVTVPDGGEATADFRLVRSAIQLEAVVTTATGEQSRKSVGNVVASVKVDSLVGTMPLTSVNDVLTARTSGVQVQLGSGQTGSAPSIRIRGVNSLSLSNEPLIIVDGVRADNSPAPGNFSTQRINRFTSFNPEDVESIDIIKGPSAAALYGTAAANGVVVIKTKRGRVGRTEWRANFEGGQVSQPATFFDNYRSWGRNLVNGTPTAAAVLCRVSDASLGRCVVDSLTTFNPLSNPETTPFASQPRYNYGVSTSGGNEKLRFFISADREDEIGPYEMPASEIARLTTLRGTRPRPGQIHPNQLGQTSVRGNFNLGLAPNLELAVTTGYSDRTLNSLFDGGFFAGLSFQSYFAPGFRT